jgi:GT2 family glycosyltransferase/tetratricopeptide (TPR) repeat protein
MVRLGRWFGQADRGAAGRLLGLAKALERAPDDAALWAEVARLAGGKGATDGPPTDDPVAEADRLRAAQQPGPAAESYRQALERWPERTDLRVQLGNMLKDSGRPAAAEVVYREALLQRPGDADLHLQLGHALKLQGRRTSAMAAYRSAVALDAASPAHAELALAGSPAEQRERSDAHWRSGGTAAALAISAELADLREQLTQIAVRLPDAASASAFPVALWHRLRRLYAVPAPPSGPRADLAIVLVARGVPVSLLQRQVAAFACQGGDGWRLQVVAPDATARPVIALAAAADPRIVLVDAAGEDAGVWEVQAGQAAATDWCLLLADGAMLDPQATAWFATVAASHPDALGFICDEDVVEHTASGPRWTRPQLRQAVDRDTLLDANIYGETLAVRTDRLVALSPHLLGLDVADRRAALLMELCRAGVVGHIPLPLVSRPPAEAAPADRDAAVRPHRAAPGAAAEPLPITVVIPTRDNAEDVAGLVASLRGTAAHGAAVRFAILDNGGQDAAGCAALAALAGQPGATVRRVDAPFNWSAFNNLAANETDAPLLVFANDDMRMLTPGWDTVLRGLLARADVGAVGARLLYEDGTIQHAGIVFGWGGEPTHHDGLYEPAEAPGPTRRWQVTRSVAAVTGAFLATRRDRFLSAGGFDPALLPVAYSDIDYALKLRAQGLRVIWTPRITLTHKEGASRGRDDRDPTRVARNTMERLTMQQRWGEALRVDPGVNPHYYPATLPFHLVAAPSAERVAQHIAACASPEPWRVAPAFRP